jgi:3-hydroxy-D-aspartate aldolase
MPRPIADYHERKRAIRNTIDITRSTVRLLDQNGLRCEVVSGAGTGTYAFEGSSGVFTELQVGSYAFMDCEYARIGGTNNQPYRDFEHSLFVYSTVMSRPAADRAILDAGIKAFSLERGMPLVHGMNHLEVYGASDEHAKVRIGKSASDMRLGDKLKLIPGHCDPTINLHDWYVGYRSDRVEALWPITARGASF